MLKTRLVVTVFLAGVIDWVPVMQPIVACAWSTLAAPVTHNFFRKLTTA